MTKEEFKADLTTGINDLLTTDEVTDAQKRAVRDQMISNLNLDTVNPDKPLYPAIKG